MYSLGSYSKVDQSNNSSSLIEEQKVEEEPASNESNIQQFLNQSLNTFTQISNSYKHSQKQSHSCNKSKSISKLKPIKAPSQINLKYFTVVNYLKVQSTPQANKQKQKATNLLALSQKMNEDLQSLGDLSEINKGQGDQISKDISHFLAENPENLVLSYLQKRSDLMLSKLDSMNHRVLSSFNELQRNVHDLEHKVKGQIETQQIIIDNKLYKYGLDNVNDNSQQKSIANTSIFEHKNLSSHEKKKIYQDFQEGQVLSLFKNEAVKEFKPLTVKTGSHNLMSISQLTVQERQGSQDYIVVRGQSNRVAFIDPQSLQVERYLELQQHWGNSNLRWIIQFGNQLILQLHNKYGDILFYEDEQFRKAWNVNDIFLRPIVYNTQENIYVIFPSQNGTVHLYEYQLTKMNFKLLNSFQLQQESSGLESTLGSLSGPSEVLVVKDLNLSQLLAVGQRGSGLTLIDVSLGKLRLTKYAQFLEKLSVKDIVELDKNLLLVLTFESPQYFIVDIDKKKPIGLGAGTGKLGLSLNLMPGYDPVNYPYVLCQELNSFAILDPFSNFYSEIYKSDRTAILDTDAKEDTVIFDPIMKNAFICEKDGFYLARYEINPQLLESLNLS
ncbi:UNKNOWN [Stylonychia lemnae]|uniref:Uncharacterized protein n=1 Tax=Stylonychia lemnae TaxID=5949 RepID=A0A078AQ39_STYLE|nr:UNKNOWN [Stylonychia lemnae]|eukprot:CDW84086.1 UNKNOWN [Stylonychia lemnae]